LGLGSKGSGRSRHNSKAGSGRSSRNSKTGSTNSSARPKREDNQNFRTLDIEDDVSGVWRKKEDDHNSRPREDEDYISGFPLSNELEQYTDNISQASYVQEDDGDKDMFASPLEDADDKANDEDDDYEAATDIDEDKSGPDDAQAGDVIVIVDSGDDSSRVSLSDWDDAELDETLMRHIDRVTDMYLSDEDEFQEKSSPKEKHSEKKKTRTEKKIVENSKAGDSFAKAARIVEHDKSGGSFEKASTVYAKRLAKKVETGPESRAGKQKTVAGKQNKEVEKDIRDEPKRGKYLGQRSTRQRATKPPQTKPPDVPVEDTSAEEGSRRSSRRRK